MLWRPYQFFVVYLMKRGCFHLHLVSLAHQSSLWSLIFLFLILSCPVFLIIDLNTNSMQFQLYLRPKSILGWRRSYPPHYISHSFKKKDLVLYLIRFISLQIEVSCSICNYIIECLFLLHLFFCWFQLCILSILCYISQLYYCRVNWFLHLHFQWFYSVLDCEVRPSLPCLNLASTLSLFLLPF